MAAWLCRKCGASNPVNTVAAAQGRRGFPCLACGTEHIIAMRVSVTVGRVQTRQEDAREEEALDAIRRFRMLEVSRDRGVTWREEMVNVMDTNPATSSLSAGDRIRVPGRKTALLIALENGSLVATDLPERLGA